MGLFNRKKNDEPVSALYACVSGSVIPVSEVADPVFSSKTLGDGIAIRPTCQTVTAPCTGEISMVADTLHAVGITLNNGAELLIHVGLNTVDMNGEGFRAMVKVGSKVKQGAVLIKFDKALIESKGYASDCVFLVTNSEDFPNLTFSSGMDADQDKTVVCTF